jgi:hypothetical protein
VAVSAGHGNVANLGKVIVFKETKVNENNLRIGS